MDFLDLLAERIKQAWKHPQVCGRVAFGIKNHHGITRWLLLDCNQGGQIHWHQKMPRFDAALGLDEAAAMTTVNGHPPLPGQLCIKTGDEKLLMSVLAHYFGNKTGLSLLELRTGEY